MDEAVETYDSINSIQQDLQNIQKNVQIIQAQKSHLEAISHGYANFLANICHDHDEAEEMYRRAVEADPDDGSVLSDYADFLTDARKDHDRAEEMYQRAVAANPDDATILGGYADFLADAALFTVRI